jgi:hypothetical protein
MSPLLPRKCDLDSPSLAPLPMFWTKDAVGVRCPEADVGDLDWLPPSLWTPCRARNFQKSDSLAGPKSVRRRRGIRSTNRRTKRLMKSWVGKNGEIPCEYECKVKNFGGSALKAVGNNVYLKHTGLNTAFKAVAAPLLKGDR